MTYLENETGIDMNVQFDLSAETTIKYRMAYVGVCCHVQGVVDLSTQTQNTEETESAETSETTTNTEETIKEDTSGQIPEEEQEQEEINTGNIEVTKTNTTTAAAAGGKRMLGRDSANCFGFAFYCEKVNGCKDTLSIGVALMASEVRSTESMVWKPTNTDMSSGNYGAAEKLDDREYTTRYKFNRSQSAQSNIPKKNASMTCFGAFNVPYAEYKFNRELDLKNLAKFPLVKELNMQSGKETSNREGASEVSAARDVSLQLGLLGCILLLANMV
jgi:hypothetical protein